MQTLKVQLDSGIPYAVKLVRKGETYGRGNCLTNTSDDPLVEFYDVRFAGKSAFFEEGQFIQRYSRSTILSSYPVSGLILDGGNPVWTLTRDEFRVVYAWLHESALQDVTF